MSSNPETRLFGVCGAGTMGSGIAYAAALAGYDVRLYDIAEPMLERGRASVASFIKGSVDRGKLGADAAAEVSARIVTTDSLDGLSGCGVVVEAIMEQLEAKQDLFRKLESITGPVSILASNTSSLPITAIASALQRPERCVGMHFFNPAHIMKLVEVIQGYRTSEETMERTTALSIELGEDGVEGHVWLLVIGYWLFVKCQMSDVGDRWFEAT